MLRDHGLAFPGLLWKVDSLLDLTWLQDRHGAAWALILFYTTYFQQVEDEGRSFGDFLRPYSTFFEPTMKHPATFNELSSIVSRLSNNNTVEWKPPYDRRALKIESFMLQCSILLDLILFLKANNEIGLADAIWNSTQGLSWPTDGHFKDNDDVPASVRDFSDTLPDSLKIGMLFDLETDPQGGWLQSWIVWRIMTQGQLWYRSLIEKSSDMNSPVPASCKSDSETENEIENIGGISSSLDETQLCADQLSEDIISVPRGQKYLGYGTNSKQGSVGSGPRGRYFNQLVNSIVTHKAISALLEEPGHKTDRNIFYDDPGAYLLLAQLASAGPEVESRHRERHAFFDLNEPASVLTPFNTNMEVLPRPETRAMSVSWVVKCLKISPPASEVDGRASIVEAFEFVKAVRGAWTVGHHAFMRYAVYYGHAAEKLLNMKDELHTDLRSLGDE